jgi:pimeloyl-ACP methyl ester carboxylesterase
MPFDNNEGIRIYYEIEGKGPPLVLCHGFTENLEEWRIFGYVDALKKNYRLILMDARGHGKSDKPHDPEAYKMKHRVADVVSVLDHLNIAKAHFIGYSMGGGLGWGIAKFSPERFKSLIIGGSQPYEVPLDEPDPFREFAIPLIKKGMKAVYDLISESCPELQTPEWEKMMMANDPQALLAYLYMKEYVDYKDVLPSLSQPLLLYIGEADSDHSQAKKCVKYIPNATFVSLPGLNHDEAFIRSEVILPHIIKFLEKVTESEST